MKSLRFYSSAFLFSLSSFSFFAHADLCDDYPGIPCGQTTADRYSDPQEQYKLYAESGGRAGMRPPSSGGTISLPPPPPDDIDTVTVTATREQKEQYDIFIQSSGRAGIRPPPGYTGPEPRTPPEEKKKKCEAEKRVMLERESLCVANAKTDKGINSATCSNFSYTVSPNLTFKVGNIVSGGITGSVTYATGAGCREDWANLADAQIAWCANQTARATVDAYKAGGACEGL